MDFRILLGDDSGDDPGRFDTFLVFFRFIALDKVEKFEKKSLGLIHNITERNQQFLRNDLLLVVPCFLNNTDHCYE